MPSTETDVVSFRIDQLGSSLVAVCSCGWRSERMGTAGLAGSNWDRHAESDHGKDR